MQSWQYFVGGNKYVEAVMNCSLPTGYEQTMKQGEQSLGLWLTEWTWQHYFVKKKISSQNITMN